MSVLRRVCGVWARRTVALLHCRTASTAEPARMCAHFPPSQPALLICAHISWPRHLAKAGPFVPRLSAPTERRRFEKCAHFSDARGEIYSIPQNVRTNQESRLRGREMCAHSPWFSGATVQQCDGARPESGPGGPSSALQVDRTKVRLVTDWPRWWQWCQPPFPPTGRDRGPLATLQTPLIAWWDDDL